MQTKLVFFILIFTGFYSFGQRDLILTQAGKEIRCKILEESSMRYTYAYINEKGVVVKTEIFKTLVSSFKRDYYPEDLLPNEKLFKSGNPIVKKEVSSGNRMRGEEKSEGKKREPVKVKRTKEEEPEVNIQAKKGSLAAKEKEFKSEFANFLKYRFGIKGGLANMMKENTDKSDYGLYNEKLGRGWMYGLDFTSFLNDYIGIGITYNSFQTKNKNDWFDFPRTLTQEVKTGSLQDKLSQRFVGPMVVGRIPLDFKTFIVASASPGYYFYRNKRVEDELNLDIKGNTFGLATTLGLDFLIGDDEYGRDVILSFECGYNYGKLTQLNYGGTVGTQSLATPIDLSRLDFCVGIRFNRFPRFLK